MIIHVRVLLPATAYLPSLSIMFRVAKAAAAAVVLQSRDTITDPARSEAVTAAGPQPPTAPKVKTPVRKNPFPSAI